MKYFILFVVVEVTLAILWFGVPWLWEKYKIHKIESDMKFIRDYPDYLKRTNDLWNLGWSTRRIRKLYEEEKRNGK